MIAYIRRHWRGEFSLAASLLINIPLSIALPSAVFVGLGRLLLGNVPRDILAVHIWGGFAFIGVCALWGVIGAVRCAIRLIRAPGGSLVGKLVPAALLAALVLAIVSAIGEDLQLILRSH